MNADILVALSGAVSAVIVGVLTWIGARRSAKGDSAATLLEQRRLQVAELQEENARLEEVEDNRDLEIRQLHLQIESMEEQARQIAATNREQERLLRAEIEYLKDLLGIDNG